MESEEEEETKKKKRSKKKQDDDEAINDGKREKKVKKQKDKTKRKNIVEGHALKDWKEKEHCRETSVKRLERERTLRRDKR